MGKSVRQPPPPPGFQLEANNQPPPPEGFQLEQGDNSEKKKAFLEDAWNQPKQPSLLQPDSSQGSGQSQSASPSQLAQPAQPETPSMIPEQKPNPQKTALDNILKVARTQAGQNQFFDNAADPQMEQLQKNIGDENPIVKGVLTGDVNTIADVVNKHKAAVKAAQQQAPANVFDADNRSGSLQDQVLGHHNEEQAAQSTDADFNQKLNDEAKAVVSDGVKLIDTSIYNQWKQGTDTEGKSLGNTDSALQVLGAKKREALAKMDVKPDYPITDDGGIASDKLKIAAGKTGESGQAMQELFKNEQAYAYKNHYAALQSIQSGLEDQLDQLSANPVIEKLKAAVTSGDKVTIDTMKQDPTVKQFMDVVSQHEINSAQAKNLYKQYPTVAKEFYQQQEVSQFAEDYLKQWHGMGILGKAAHVAERTILNFKPSEEEIKSIATTLGRSEDEVREAAKNMKLPSLLDNATNGFVDTYANMYQWANRKVLTNLGLLSGAEADQMNENIEKNVKSHSPEIAFGATDQKGNRNFSLVAGLGGAMNGMGQLGAFALATHGIGGGLAATGDLVAKWLKPLAEWTEIAAVINGSKKLETVGRALNLSSEFLSPSVPGIAEDGETLKIIQAGQRAKELAGTYGSGYASSYEDLYQEGKKYSDDPKKWEAYANAGSVLNGLSMLILPDIDYAKKIGVRNNVMKLMQTGKPVLEGKELFSAYMSELTKVIGKTTMERFIPVLGEAVAKSQIFDYQTSAASLAGQLANTFSSNLVASLPMAFLGMRGVKASNFTAATLDKIGSQREKYHAMVDDLVKQGKLKAEDVNDRKQLINTIADIRNALPPNDINGKPISQENRVKLMAASFQRRYYNALQENADKAFSAKLGDENGSMPSLKLYEDKIQEANNVINSVMQGRDPNPQLTKEDVEAKQSEEYRKHTGIAADMEQKESALNIAGLKEADPETYNRLMDETSNPKKFYSDGLKALTAQRDNAEKNGNEKVMKEAQKGINEIQKKLDHIKSVDDIYDNIKFKLKENEEKQQTETSVQQDSGEGPTSQTSGSSEEGRSQENGNEQKERLLNKPAKRVLDIGKKLNGQPEEKTADISTPQVEEKQAPTPIADTNEYRPQAEVKKLFRLPKTLDKESEVEYSVPGEAPQKSTAFDAVAELRSRYEKLTKILEDCE